MGQSKLTWEERDAKRAREAAKRIAMREKRMAARAAKNVVNSHHASTAASGETKAPPAESPKIVPGGLPGHGRRR